MKNLKLYNYIRALSLLALVVVCLTFLNAGIFGVLILSLPYLFIIFISNEKRYRTHIRSRLRALAGAIVFLLALGLIFGVKSDPQAGIGIMFGVVIQFGVLFVSEALIGLFSYEEGCT